MSNDALAVMIGQRFVSQIDKYAVQTVSGQYMPARDSNGNDLMLRTQALLDHLVTRRTYGNYIVNSNNEAKFFAFDCDLNETGTWVHHPDLSIATDEQVRDPNWLENSTQIYNINPREAWLDRSNPARDWLKYQMRALAELLTSVIHKELQIPVCATYTGSKGIHVYGFTGLESASTIRDAAQYVLKYTRRFEPIRGSNFYQDSTTDPRDSFNNFTVEIYPKQDHIEKGGYGNLLRFPFGRNLKNPNDPCFVIDQRIAHKFLAPHDNPLEVLSSGNPWKD